MHLDVSHSGNMMPIAHCHIFLILFRTNYTANFTMENNIKWY
ncbi:CRISPR-associated DxTHG motif protein [Psychrobacter sp. F1192]|uniref:CRISPR-associated DxTHG motif protein n=1 Tax=Psychrobacter coccoides TaxID=2818440 RepID=A0ABS3NK58_9GAMM|nr:CRISPR-associated DxTHG motif protein [Psychrobacter coccoides]